MKLAYATYLDAIAEEADRLEDLPPRFLEKKVPSCPQWTLRDLLVHLANVYEFWRTQVKAADPSGRVDAVVGCTEPSSLAVENDLLVAALEEAGPDSPCWSWSGDELNTSFVARRMALESAVHRVDGEQTLGRPLPVDTELSIDGVEERLAVHLAADLAGEPSVGLGGSICLICSDAPAAWVVEVERGQLRWRHGRGPADAVLVGSASEVFLFAWNRVTADSLSVTGDRGVAEAWRRLPC